MFHWICPECGQEIAPGVKECPVCEPGFEHASSASPLPTNGLSAAVAPAPEVPVAAPVVEQRAPVVKTPAPEPEIVTPPPIVLQPEIVLRPEIILRPKPAENPQPRGVPEALLATPPEIALPEAPKSVLPELVASKPPEPETFADRLADLAEHLHGERISYAAPRIIAGTATPGPHADQTAERTPLILDVTPTRPLLAPPPSMLLLEEPQPPAIASAFPAEQVFHPRLAEHPARSLQPMEAEPAGLSVVPGPVQLPNHPDRAAEPALAPLQDYYKAADRQMRPASYGSKMVVGAAEPKVTLPGPALPRELMSLQAAGLVPIRKGGRRADAPPNRYGWTTRLLVLGILLTAGAAATYRVMPGSSASVPVMPAPEAGSEQPAASRPENSNSLARFVEVTGVRFLEVNKKPQIRYLVVNHSSAPLNSVTIYVTLRASNWKPGQPPLSRFTFRSPDLAGFEAKEMASPIERVIGPLDLPAWQDLHADVEVQ